MPGKPSVSLVIPMYNEELNIEHAIAAAVESLTKYADDYEIIIVDDASTDDSPAMVRRAAEENPRIRPIRQIRGPFPHTTIELAIVLWH